MAGLATGAILPIVAVGLALLWQTSQTIDFAQGEFVCWHSDAGGDARRRASWLAIVIGMLLSMLLLGLGFKMCWSTEMLRHGVLPLAIATMALAIGIEEAVDVFQREKRASIVPAGDISALGRQVALQSVGVLALAIAAVVDWPYPQHIGHQDAGHCTKSDCRPHHRHSRRADPADVPDRRFWSR